MSAAAPEAGARVTFSGGTGYASRAYLAMGGAVVPGPAVAVTPYVYDDDDYGLYGYSYGPTFGFYAGPQRHWRGHRWHGGWRGHAGNWSGRPGWSGNRVGTVPSGTNQAIGGRPAVSAPVGMSRGPAAGGAQVGPGGGAGVFQGGAGVRAQGR